MDKETRNKLRNTIVDCRKLLEADVLDQLQGTFGIHRDGRIEPETALPHLDDGGLDVRRRAVAAIEHIEGYGLSQSDAVDQFQREVAFTHLNRLCAFKMLERRGLLEETVSRGNNSNGFKVYLASHPDDERRWRSGDEHLAYRNFLFDVCAQLSEEIKVLFDTEHVSSHLFPSQRALAGVLDLINAEPLADIWESDETIGWIYQYFTPKELREKARKESAAPRNSYELAFRNQFYTPRYVVQFLTDNTLGRTWYEMRKGETRLVHQCEYMVRRPTEIFLEPGEKPPPEPEHDDDLSQDELLKQPVHVRHREKKVPWEIKVLDPACGSGHFVLYAFDLLETIYDEAYDDPDIGPRVRALHPNRERYAADVPAMILRHNLHGIDIDLRSTQIAALALWMRAQRSFQRLGLSERPKIERTNIVCAEPMPGDEALLEEFCEGLQPSLVGDLVRDIWGKMKLAGEAGSLLKIEEEIRDVVRRAQEAWRNAPKGYKISLFDGTVQRPVEQAEFDFSEVTGPEFWQKAESLLLDALALFASRAANGREYGRRLFKDDAEQGFAFIELCRERYDVVLMNPPFGAGPESLQKPLADTYPKWATSNLICGFLSMGGARLAQHGYCASVVDRTVLARSSFETFRKDYLLTKMPLVGAADWGWGVLDANVEVSSVIFQSGVDADSVNAFGIDLADSSSREADLVRSVREPLFIALSQFRHAPYCSINFRLPNFFKRARRELPALERAGAFFNGHTIKGDVFKRLVWELRPEGAGKSWLRMWNGSGYSPHYVPMQEAVLIKDYAGGLENHSSTIIRNPDVHLKPGLCYGKRGDFLDVQVLPAGHILTTEGFGGPFPNTNLTWYLLGLLNSGPLQYSLNLYSGQHKQVGYVHSLPCPQNGSDLVDRIAALTQAIVERLRRMYASVETDPHFLCPSTAALSGKGSWISDSTYVQERQELAHLSSQIDGLTATLLGMEATELDEMEASLSQRPAFEIFPWLSAKDHAARTKYFASVVVSYGTGAAFGRWDIRRAMGDEPAPPLTDAFEPLPTCPPGMLVGPDGLPARPDNIVSEEWLRARPNAITLPAEGSVSRPTIPDSEYSLEIVWDGILVDDPDHQDDIVRRVREVLELLWEDRAGAIEREACEILGVKSLREYFRNPKHFWNQHVKRYSKSRRKAPIYWLLQSPGRHYALWLYYHRLDQDILYKALRNYVDPKHRLEESRLKELQGRLPATPEGRERKALEKQIDDQEAVVNDVLDLKERLEKVAKLGLDPDLNDGVVLNIAPLHELVPWTEPKKYWDDLLAGKYEWSTVGKQLREKGLVRG